MALWILPLLKAVGFVNVGHIILSVLTLVSQAFLSVSLGHDYPVDLPFRACLEDETVLLR
jgi:hypothetical protein